MKEYYGLFVRRRSMRKISFVITIAAFILAGFLNVAVLNVAQANAGSIWKYGMERNTDRAGQDYKNFDLALPEPMLCANACMGEPNCKAWTYVKPGVQGNSARCWLKNGVPGASPNDCCVSGVKGKGGAPVIPTGTWKYGMERDTDRAGQDYKNFDLALPEPMLCANACMGEPNCKAWTYVKPGVQGNSARCWLKNSVPGASPNDCCVSGVKGKGGAPIVPTSIWKYGMERDTDRAGQDYKNFDLASPEPMLCANACMGEAKCKAWTYVKPGVQGNSARCWLKNSIPGASPNDCCVSGVKKR